MSAPSVPGYEGLELIGKGGFSRVYRAEQSKLKRDVALKVLNFGLNDEADRRSFERETELMGRVSTHPHIVTVHDTAFTVEGQPCIVMENYRGGSLADLISEAGIMTTQEVLEVGVAIASALDTSHRSGILHCDLKPQNILISDFGQAALGDFGISTFTEERTRTGSDTGAGFTLAYAAPEIVEGESPSVATDLYSLAATLYTALAGRRPFVDPQAEAKPTPAEHARRILLESAPPLINTPDEVARVILSAMSKDPDQRPASAADFAIALYEIGQRLGYGTPLPSTLDRSALASIDTETRPATGSPRTPRQAEPDKLDPFGSAAPAALAKAVPAAAPPADLGPFGTPLAPAAPPAPAAVTPPVAPANAPRDLDDATIHRSDVDLDLPAGSAPDIETEREPAPNSNRRGIIAGAVAVVSLLVAAGLLFAFSGGDASDSTDPAEDDPAAPTSQPAAQIVTAPNQPVNIAIERLGATRVGVTWDPVADSIQQNAGFVTYEVRRQGDPEVYETTEPEFVITGVAANEAPCVTVLAIRGNRVSPESDPICLAPQVGTAIAVRPEMCEQGTCEVRVVLTDFAANSPVSLVVLDPDGRDINGFGEVYERQATTDARAQIDEWRLSLPPLLDAGEYIVLIGDDVGETYSALLTVLPSE